MTTFYMVEMHYPATEDRRQFDAFYDKHITMLLTIDGCQSAQRYESIHEARAPFLAVYRLRDPDVMTSENYTSKAGRSSVDPVFRAKMTNWDRNLVQGDIADMNVPEGGRMVLIDRMSPDSPPLPKDFTPLAVVGLDSTIVQRGVRILGKGEAVPQVEPADGWTVRTFQPIHPVRYPA
jgi:hypothetical protein